MFCFKRKIKKQDGKKVQPPVISLIRDVLAKDPQARITSVRLFMNKYNLKLDYIRDSRTWISHVESGGNAILAVTFACSHDVSVNEDTTAYKVIDSKADSGKIFTLVLRYDSSISAPEWSLVSGPNWIPDESFELAETIEGPFPLTFLQSYLLQTQYMVYSSRPSGAGENLKGTSLKEEKDFSLGFVIYLSHLSGIFQSVIDARKYAYTIAISRNQSLLTTERRMMGDQDGMVGDTVRRIY